MYHLRAEKTHLFTWILTPHHKKAMIVIHVNWTNDTLHKETCFAFASVFYFDDFRSNWKAIANGFRYKGYKHK